jgi:hypothetical protein
MTVESWADNAACKGKTDLFYPDRGDTKSYREAVAICGICPVFQQCRQHIDENDERFGVWAGTNAVRRMMERNPDSDAQWTRCGTVKSYQYGCRCDVCREVFMQWQRDRRARLGAAVAPGAHTGNTTE